MTKCKGARMSKSLPLVNLSLLRPMLAGLHERSVDPEKWTRFFDQFSAELSYNFGFISGGDPQVRVPATISLARRQQPMR